MANPTWGDKVHVESYQESQRSPRGKIEGYDEDEDFYYVQYDDGHWDRLKSESFAGMWTNKFEGMWLIRKGSEIHA